jgi:hypothetical protein
MNDTATLCDPCFYDWHESCRSHELLGTCCCGAEDLNDEDDDEW